MGQAIVQVEDPTQLAQLHAGIKSLTLCRKKTNIIQNTLDRLVIELG